MAMKLRLSILKPWCVITCLRLPPPGFLERVRELCTQYNIVMSMDEVITGFRVGLGGAQGLLGVTPDIATLGKSFGGGLPISAVVGKAEILGLLSDGKVLGPGTFNGNPLCVRSAKATLAILEQGEGAVYQEMGPCSKKTNGWTCRNRPAQSHSITRIQSVAGVFYTLFGIDPEQEQYTQEDMADFDGDMSERFTQSMQAEGVYTLGPRWYPSIAHGDMRDGSRIRRGKQSDGSVMIFNQRLLCSK